MIAYDFSCQINAFCSLESVVPFSLNILNPRTNKSVCALKTAKPPVPRMKGSVAQNR